jgi:hypothetical protein
MGKTFSIQEGSKLMLLTPLGTIELLASETKVSDHYSSTSFIEIIYNITSEASTNPTIEEMKHHTAFRGLGGLPIVPNWN